MIFPSTQSFINGGPYTISSCHLLTNPIGPDAPLATVSALKAKTDQQMINVRSKLQLRRAKRVWKTGLAARALVDFQGPWNASTTCLTRKRKLGDPEVEVSRKAAKQRNTEHGDREPEQDSANTVLVAAGAEDNDGDRGRDSHHINGFCGRCGKGNGNNGDGGIDGNGNEHLKDSDCTHSWDESFNDPSDTCMECKYCIYDLWHFDICRLCPLVCCQGCGGAQPGPRVRVKCGPPCCPGGRRSRDLFARGRRESI